VEKLGRYDCQPIIAWGANPVFLRMARIMKMLAYLKMAELISIQ